MKNYGFTLVEILVVVVILSIAALIVTPSIGGGFDSIRVPAAARMVLSDILYAQNEAITRQQMTYLMMTPDASAPTGYSVALKYNPSAKEDYLVRPGDGGPMKAIFGNGGSGPMGRTAINPFKQGGDNRAGLAFDSLGSPYTVDASGSTSPMSRPATLVVQNSAGDFKMTLTIQPFTGEVEIQ